MYEPFENFRNPRNMKSLDWYDSNSVLLNENTWRDLKKNDMLIYAYNESRTNAGAGLKEVLEVFGRGDTDLTLFTNFELIDKDTKTYAYDIHDVWINPSEHLVIKKKRHRHDGYSMKYDIESNMGFYLITPQFTKDFLNYTQLPNTK